MTSFASGDPGAYPRVVGSAGDVPLWLCHRVVGYDSSTLKSVQNGTVANIMKNLRNSPNPSSIVVTRQRVMAFWRRDRFRGVSGLLE